MKIILIGNIITFIGALVMIGIGFIKSKKNIILAQCAQFAIMGIGNLVLGGVTGFITNIVSIIRNLFCIKLKFTTPVKIVFIVVQMVISAVVNQSGIIGWLPIAATCIFTWFLDTENEVLLKWVIIITVAMWIVYDLSFRNFSSAFFDVMTMVSNAIGIIMIKKKAKNDLQSL